MNTESVANVLTLLDRAQKEISLAAEENSKTLAAIRAVDEFELLAVKGFELP